jgi:NAD-dependent DNA ligase
MVAYSNKAQEQRRGRGSAPILAQRANFEHPPVDSDSNKCETVKNMPPKRAKKSDSDPFEGMVVAISGTFTVSQGEMKKLLEEGGASIAGSVTRKVRLNCHAEQIWFFTRNKDAIVCSCFC